MSYVVGLLVALAVDGAAAGRVPGRAEEVATKLAVSAWVVRATPGWTCNAIATEMSSLADRVMLAWSAVRRRGDRGAMPVEHAALAKAWTAPAIFRIETCPSPTVPQEASCPASLAVTVVQQSGNPAIDESARVALHVSGNRVPLEQCPRNRYVIHVAFKPNGWTDSDELDNAIEGSRSHDWLVRLLAARALGEMIELSPERVRQAMSLLATDSHDEVRTLARELLAERGGR